MPASTEDRATFERWLSQLLPWRLTLFVAFWAASFAVLPIDTDLLLKAVLSGLLGIPFVLLSFRYFNYWLSWLWWAIPIPALYATVTVGALRDGTINFAQWAIHGGFTLLLVVVAGIWLFRRRVLKWMS